MILLRVFKYFSVIELFLQQFNKQIKSNKQMFFIELKKKQNADLFHLFIVVVFILNVIGSFKIMKTAIYY